MGTTTKKHTHDKNHPPLALIISLPEAAARRDRLTAALGKQGFTHYIIDAVDGRTRDMTAHKSYDRPRRIRYFGRDMLGGEIGCFLSHRAALMHIVEQNVPHALVFEDDAIIQDTLSAAVTFLTTHKNQYDFVRFIAKDKVYNAPQKNIEYVDNDMRLVRLMGTPGGAYAYFVTRRGAQKLLNKMDKFYMPVDTLMGHGWITGVDNLCLIPSPVAHGALDDTFIGGDRFNKDVRAVGWARLLYPLTRFFYKTRENIMKRMCFWWRNIRGI